MGGMTKHGYSDDTSDSLVHNGLCVDYIRPGYLCQAVSQGHQANLAPFGGIGRRHIPDRGRVPAPYDEPCPSWIAGMGPDQLATDRRVRIDFHLFGFDHHQVVEIRV